MGVFKSQNWFGLVAKCASAGTDRDMGAQGLGTESHGKMLERMQKQQHTHTHTHNGTMQIR